MRQWKLVIALAMILAFAAGTLIGLGRGRSQRPSSPDQEWPDRHGPGHGPPEFNLSETLSLTPAQRTQVRAIWEALLQDGPNLFEQRREIQSRFRAKAEALLSPDQKKQYDTLQAECAAELARHEQAVHANFETAVAKTKALLTPEQREKYDQILARHHGPDDPGGPGNHGPGDHGGPHGPRHDDPNLLGPSDSFGPPH